MGVEFNPDLVALSNRTAARDGVAERVSFVQGDMYAADISRASVLALFLLPDNLRRLVPKFLELKPGSRIVVNYFGIDGWTPDVDEEMKSGCEPWCIVKLYIVPARVAGAWRHAQGELVLEQNFQMLRGTLSVNGVRTEIAKARLDGERISFSAGEVRYSGRVLGNRIEGERTAGAGAAAGAWTAFRQ